MKKATTKLIKWIIIQVSKCIKYMTESKKVKVVIEVSPQLRDIKIKKI